MLLSKTKNLESENNGMEEAIDLMKVELQNMNTNEQGLVSKVRNIDMQNQALLEESSALKGESDFYKDKSRQLEIQLTQSVGNERILNENVRTMEDRNIQLQSEVARLKDSSSRAYEELAREAQQLQLQLNEIAGRELALQNNLKNYESDNNRLQNDLLNSQSRQNEYNRQIAILNADNNNLMQQIEATQQMRMRLRNDIIGVIDQNDNGSGTATRNRN
jgi:chromosome segregation ATPase